MVEVTKANELDSATLPKMAAVNLPDWTKPATVGEIAEARVWDEAFDAAKDWEAGAFDGGLPPGFVECEDLERIARDEPVGDVRGIESYAAARVAGNWSGRRWRRGF